VIKVLAQRGDSFLLQTDEEHGRVLDARHRRLFAPTRLSSLVARGYWDEFTGDERRVLELLTEVEDVAQQANGQTSFSSSVLP
jgi:hypothetical protein